MKHTGAIEDNALRDTQTPQSADVDESSWASESERQSTLSWEELSLALSKAQSDKLASEASSFIVCHPNCSYQTFQQLMMEGHWSPAQSDEASLNSGWNSLSQSDALPEPWSYPGHKSNKIVLTSQTFDLPWSLEAVIRPETPIHEFFCPSGSASSLYLDEPVAGSAPARSGSVSISTMITQPLFNPSRLFLPSEDGYEEDEVLTQAVHSVVSRTVRLPVSLASHMVILILKLAQGTATPFA